VSLFVGMSVRVFVLFSVLMLMGGWFRCLSSECVGLMRCILIVCFCVIGVLRIVCCLLSLMLIWLLWSIFLWCMIVL